MNGQDEGEASPTTNDWKRDKKLEQVAQDFGAELARKLDTDYALIRFHWQFETCS